MKKSVLLASLIAAAALTACGKKEEPAPAVVHAAACRRHAGACARACPGARRAAPRTPSPGASSALDAANAATEARQEAAEAAATQLSRLRRCCASEKAAFGRLFSCVGLRRRARASLRRRWRSASRRSLAPSASAITRRTISGRLFCSLRCAATTWRRPRVLHGARDRRGRVVRQMAVVAADALLEEGRVGRSRPACRCRG